MPMVEAQVENQIPLHDLSNTSVSIAPADYSSWHEVRTELMGEAKAGLKARVDLNGQVGAAMSWSAGLLATVVAMLWTPATRPPPAAIPCPRCSGRNPIGATGNSVLLRRGLV